MFLIFGLSCKISLYIMDTYPLLCIWFANNFSHTIGCLFTLCVVIIYFLYLFFNWSIISLLCCVTFCCTTMWISSKYTYILSPHASLPLSLPTPLGHHRAWSWASCAIQQLPTYGSVYTSVLLSQFVPPAPFRPVSTSLSHRLCLYFCLTNRFINTIFLDSIYMHKYMIFVFLFLTDFTLYDRL